MSVSEAFFSEGLCYMETSQFICIVYQLVGYCVIGVFTEKCFWTDICIVSGYIHLKPLYGMTSS